MEEYDTLEKVKALFESVNCVGEENCYFVLMRDMSKATGMIGLMEYPYFALLINQTENGIGCFHLVLPDLSLKIILKNLVVSRESFTFIKNEDIEKITVKNYALLSKKTKSVTIKIKDQKTRYFCAKPADDTLPYHSENFSRFVARYSK